MPFSFFSPSIIDSLSIVVFHDFDTFDESLNLGVSDVF